MKKLINVIDNILHRKFLVHSDWTRFLDVCVIVLAGVSPRRSNGRRRTALVS